MGFGTDGLTFNTLRSANLKRLPLFKDANGRPCHTKLEGRPDGFDWSPAQWLQAVVGELGEYANARKKVERGDMTEEEARNKLASELADVVIYLDLLAHRLDINLGDAVMKTWNAKSEQLGIPLYMDAEDWHYTKHTTHVSALKVGDEVKGRYSNLVGTITDVTPAGFFVRFGDKEPVCMHPQLHIMAIDGSEIVGGLPRT